jgi:hypothetical protein
VVEHLPGTRETLCLIIRTAKEKGEREREIGDWINFALCNLAP